MFSKRKLNKVDLLSGIKETESQDFQVENEPKISKKFKKNIIEGWNTQGNFNQELEPQEYKAANNLSNEQKEASNKFSVLIEKPIKNEEKNQILLTVQKYQNMKTIDEIFNPNSKTLKETNQPKKNNGTIIAPSNVRFNCRFDYNPSLCKDYHDTGYCTFGDSCIYGHDRGDYKAGWELEKEWEDMKRKKEQKLLNGQLSDTDSEYEQAISKYQVPSECSICGNDLNKPVRTKCDHYFCEQCALKRFRESSKCSVCGKETVGIFMEGEKSIQKIIEKRDQIEQEFKFRKQQLQKNGPKSNKIADTEIINEYYNATEDKPQIVTLNEEMEEIKQLQQQIRKVQNKKQESKFQRCESDWRL